MDRTKDTTDELYTQRLLNLQSSWWKRLLNVQAPYAWNLRRNKLGFTLEIGCGIGRNLRHLRGNGVGIDHNRYSVLAAKSFGLTCFTPEEFQKSEYNRPNRFDSILCSHVLEHMSVPQAVQLLRQYLPTLKKDGKILVITPQEVGFHSDETHVEFMDDEKVKKVIQESGASLVKQYSFPFPRWAGKFFIYNEFIALAQVTSTDYKT